jgi:hypothetical protein
MENIAQDQAYDLREKRRRMFEQMGVSHAGQVMSESAVGTGAKNLNILQKIQQIKSGAAKSELNKYVNASSKGGGNLPGAQGFDPLPEYKPNKSRGQNPNMPQQQVDPKHKVELDSFASSSSHVDNSELSMIDAMFGGGGSRGGFSPQKTSFDNGQSFMQQRPQDFQVDLSSTLNQMPTFNHNQAIQRAKAKSDQTYLQFAQNKPIGAPEDYVFEDTHANQQMAGMNFTPQMKMMMETIAKTMAEQTMKKVLSEFTEQQKNKNYFEIYNKDQSIVRTGDGKLYKLTPVQVKKRG